MKSDWSTQLTKTVMAFAMMVTFCAPAFAQDADTAKVAKKKVPTRVSKTRAPAEGYSHVEMFSAMDDGTIKVELIPKDATQSSIFVTNNSDQPLAVEMPEAFVGVPILAQGFGGGGGGGLGGGGGGNRGGGGGGFGGGGGGQGLGGGAGGGGGGGGFGGGGGGGGRGGGGGGGGFGGGVFNIPPGKRARVKVTTVCLEFNKIDPRPSIKYEIKPAADYVKDEAVIEMLKMVANDEVTQPIAQAAAWHRMDGLSWEFLANHNRKELSNGYFERFFTPNQVSWAQELVPFADKRVATVKALKANQEESKQWRTDGR